MKDTSNNKTASMQKLQGESTLKLYKESIRILAEIIKKCYRCISSGIKFSMVMELKEAVINTESPEFICDSIAISWERSILISIIKDLGLDLNSSSMTGNNGKLICKCMFYPNFDPKMYVFSKAHSLFNQEPEFKMQLPNHENHIFPLLYYQSIADFKINSMTTKNNFINGSLISKVVSDMLPKENINFQFCDITIWYNKLYSGSFYPTIEVTSWICESEDGTKVNMSKSHIKDISPVVNTTISIFCEITDDFCSQGSIQGPCNMKEISDEMNNLVIPGMQNDFEDVSLKVISKNIKDKLSLIKHISYTVDLSDSKKINIHTELLPIYKVVI